MKNYFLRRGQNGHQLGRRLGEGKYHVGRIKPMLEKLGSALEYCQMACVYGHRSSVKVKFVIALLTSYSKI